MWINLKRVTLGALLLATWSLLLSGCGSYSEPAPTYNVSDSKLITGTVSDLTTSKPVSGASVTAYAISNGILTSTKALSETVLSGTDGSYALHIPVSYTGSIQIQATGGLAKLINRLAKMLFLSYTSPTIRAIVTESTLGQIPIPPVPLNFASEVVALFIEKNLSDPARLPSGYTETGFTEGNIQKASLVLESIFGANFLQVQLPQNTADSIPGSTTNTSYAAKSEQDLLVSITAITTVLNQTPGITLTDIVVRLATIGLGNTISDAIKTATAAVSTQLIQDGTLPPEYTPSTSVNTSISNAQNAPVLPPSLSDTLPPTAPAGLTAAAVNSRTISLAWIPSTDNSGTVDGYVIYRADSTGVFTAINTIRNVTTNPVTYFDPTASSITTYTYKIVAFDAARNFSDGGNSATVTTPAQLDPVDTTPPTTPAGLISKGFTDSQVNIQWLQSTKSNSDGSVIPAAGYYVYRNSEIIATVTGTSFIDTHVTPATSYTYYIKAFDASSNVSAASTPLDIRTSPSAGATPPSAPSALALSSAALYNQVELGWNVSATSGVTYNIYRGSDLIATGINSNHYTDVTIIANSSYVYTVSAVGATGESARSNQLAVTVPASPNSDQTAPSVPQNLALVTPATSNSVALTWAASTKTDGNKIVAGYDVLRGDSSGNNFVVIATVSTPGYNDTSVAPSSTYTYKISSFSSTGTHSAASVALTVATAATVNVTDTTPPTAPTGLRLNSAATSNSVDLTWTASTKSTGDHVVAGYKIYRNGAQIGDVISVGFIDTTVTGTTTYTYSVKAYDNPGNISASSNELSVTTPIQPPATYTLNGRVTFNGIGLSGVTMVIIGTGTGSTTTDANGNYSFTKVLNGGYSITASRAGYLFAPGSLSVLVHDANVSGLNFTSSLPGTITGGVDYPTGSITSGITYPPGTIIGGVTYPNSTVIGGVTYPTSTVIGGVTYPTGTVIGGITYPNGVVIGGVTYPAGTVVGGIAFPPGTVTTGVFYPTGTVIGGVTYPAGTVIGGVIYPSGTAITNVTYPTATVISGLTYPTGRVIGGVAYPAGAVNGLVSYPNGSVVSGGNYPTGTVIGGITYPNGTVIGGIYYPTSTVIGGVVYPTGTVVGGVSYPNGVVIGGVTYPAGTVVGGVAFPPGTVIGNFSYPSGTIVGGITYPNSTVIGGVTYPTSTVVGGVTYSTGTVIGGVTYPNGIVIGGVSYPAGTVIGGVAFPPGTVTGNFSYPSGTIIGGNTYPSGLVNGAVTYPNGTIVGGITYPNSTVVGGVTYTTSTVYGGATYLTGTVIGGVTYPNGVVIGGVSYPAGTVVGGVAFPPGTVTSNFSYTSTTVFGGVVYEGSTASSSSAYPQSVLNPGVSYSTGSTTGVVTYPNGSASTSLTWNVIIYGTATDNTGNYLAGVTVNVYEVISGTPALLTQTTTGFIGSYSFMGTVGKTYRIVPTLAGYTFAAIPDIFVVDDSTNIAVNFSSNP